MVSSQCYIWRYRWWKSDVDEYGTFVPAESDPIPDSSIHKLEVNYKSADPPFELGIEECESGVYLLSLLPGNVRGYEVKIEGSSSGFSKSWKYVFIPGENPTKINCSADVQGKKTENSHEIPFNVLPTLLISLTIPDTYEVCATGSTPLDETKN